MARQAPPPYSKFNYQIERNLDWSELDQLGHANNARYFTWFEEARMNYFRQVGIPVSGNLSWGPILAHTECTFLAPVTWPNSLVLCAKTVNLGTSSLNMTYAVYTKTQHLDHGIDQGLALDHQVNGQKLNKSDHGLRCVAFGTGVIVLVNYETGQKLEISAELREAINTFES